MSTIDQAFVNAFARRNQRSAKPIEREVARESTPTPESWTDTDTGQVVRPDSAAAGIPQPRVDAADLTATETAQPSALQQLNKDYVYGQTETASPPMDDADVDVKPHRESIKLRVDQASTPDEPTIKLHTKSVTQPPEKPAPDPIQPVWEVDAFDIPTSVEQLFFEEKLFQLVAKRIQDAVNDGLESIMVTSVKSGEGRSTVAIGMAMAAAATGLRVALIDGDTQEPTLADDMRLDVDFGWVDTLRGGLPLSQIAVLSIEDGLTLIPLMPPQHQQASASTVEIQRLIEAVGDQYDLVIIDAPAGDQPLVEHFAKSVDSAIIARDASRTDIDTVNELSYRLSSSGVQGVGIVENFS